MKIYEKKTLMPSVRYMERGEYISSIVPLTVLQTAKVR